MGFFVLPLSKTVKGNIEEAKANLRLYKSTLPKDDKSYDYLIGVAEYCLDEALKKLEEKK